MAGKSRRSRGRHVPRSKRKKGKGVFTPRTQPAVVAPQDEPPRADTVVPSTKAPTPKAAVAEHPNIAAELRRIGIVSGIMLVILVVVAVIFS
jgi:hypothetical protein